MHRFQMIIAAWALLIILGGCTYRLVGRIPLVMNSAEEVPEGYVKVEDKAVGKHIQRIIILFPIGEFPKMGKAIDDALNGGRDKLMRNVDVFFKDYYVPMVYGERWFEVTGEVWQRKETLGAGGTEGR